MDAIQPYLEYFAKNPEWALLIIFLISFGEALLIIGLFVPSTVALVGAGMLVGMGQLPFWPVFWATAVGCILGDQVSYWAGRMFGVQLKQMWPLRDYAALVVKGEDFVRQHGGKSIAIGRFIPGIKAVVPGIVGMLGMNQLFFVVVNVTSGLFWTVMHVFPGILLGQGLAIAGELSDKLLIVLVVVLVILGIAGWLIRLAAASVVPRFHDGMHLVSTWAMRRSSRPMHRFGRFVSPKHPRSANVIIYGLVVCAALLGFAYLALSLAMRESVSNLDRSVTTLLGELRNSHSDDLMVPFSMLADVRVAGTMLVAIAAWLAWHKSWRASVLTLASAGLTFVAVMLTRYLTNRPGPVDHPELGAAFQASFPSLTIALASTAFGILAVLAGHAMGRWSRAVMVAMAGMWMLLIVFSKLYLGINWLSDALAGIAISAIVVGVFGLVLEAVPARRIRPLGLMAFAGLAYIAAGTLHLNANEAKQLAFFEEANVRSVVMESEWIERDWQTLPQRRIDLAGLPEDQFVAQWQGDLSTIKAHLSSNGWTTYDKWRWRDGFQYLRTDAKIADLPPKPLLNEGLKAHLTAVRPSLEKPDERLVVRLYPSRMRIAGDKGDKRVYLVSVTRDSVAPTLQLYALPATSQPTPAEIAKALGDVSSTPGTRERARHKTTAQDMVILAP
jgi:membrane protein DedA with SNARE-associated domain/membrane-associated phospholipid phosphatase